MDKENANTRNKIKQICSVKDFEEMLSDTMLSDEEKEVMRMIYKEQKTLGYIADHLGLSESSVKKKHRKILMKIGKRI